jgi:hypothetical protein
VKTCSPQGGGEVASEVDTSARREESTDRAGKKPTHPSVVVRLDEDQLTFLGERASNDVDDTR